MPANSRWDLIRRLRVKYNLRAVEYGNRFGQNWDTVMSSAMLIHTGSAEGPKCKYGKVN